MKFLKKLYLKYKMRKTTKVAEKIFEEEIQKLLPAPVPKTRSNFDIAANTLETLNKSKTSSIADIETQMEKITELIFKAKSKRVILFNPTLIERKNNKLDEPALETREGTKKVLEELTIYGTSYKSEFKRFHVNYNAEKHSLYWEI